MTHLEVITVPVERIYPEAHMICESGMDMATCFIDACGRIRIVDGIDVINFDSQEASLRVVKRDVEWVALKEQLLTPPDKKLLYGRIDHPDFADWQFMHTNEERVELLWPAIKEYKTLLEIGCHTGFFSHRFTCMGLQCTGIEASQLWAHTATVLNGYFDHSAKFYPGCAATWLATHDECFDVVLILSVIHHIFKQGKFPAVLSNLKGRCSLLITDYDEELTADPIALFIKNIELLTGLHYSGCLGEEPARKRKLLAFRRGR